MTFVLADVLEALPAYLEPLTYVEHFRSSFKEELRQKMVMFAIKDPNECVEILMTDFDRYHDMLHKVSEFQSETVRFLDAALDRLIWDPADKKMVWESFKRIGKALEVLTDKQIVSKENGNEVIWSVLTSFAKFIDICGASMSAEWYKYALDEVDQLTFLHSEEVDPLMETKTAHLTKCLKLGYAQVLLLQKNLVAPH